MAEDKIIDWSPVDQAVEKVIARHEMLFAIEMIGREKTPEAGAERCFWWCSAAARISTITTNYKQKMLSLVDSSSSVSSSSAKSSSASYQIIYRIGKDGLFSAEHVVKLLNEAGIKAELT